MCHPTGPSRCPARFPPRGGISWDRKERNKKVGILQPGKSRVLAGLGLGVAASSRGAPPQGSLTLRAPNPLSFARFLRSQRRLGNTGSPSGAGGGAQTLPAPGQDALARAYPPSPDHPGTGHNQSEVVEKPTQGASHLRYACEAYCGLRGRAP